MSDRGGWKKYERQCAELLSIWWDGNKKQFRRLPLKAGWQWDARGPDIVRLLDPKEKSPSSDVIDYSFPFFVECKKRKAMNITELVGKPPKPGNNITGWYLKTAQRAIGGKTFPMVFARFPRSHTNFIFIPLAAIPKSERKKCRYMRVTFPGAPKLMKVVGIFDAKELKKINRTKVKKHVESKRKKIKKR